MAFNEASKWYSYNELVLGKYQFEIEVVPSRYIDRESFWWYYLQLHSEPRNEGLTADKMEKESHCQKKDMWWRSLIFYTRNA